MVDERRDSWQKSTDDRVPIARQLGGIVRKGHRVSQVVFSAHPYHVFFDAGLLTIAGFTFVFAATVEPVAVLRFLVAFVIATATFELGYVPFKARVLGIDSRSYLQDLLAYVLPVWVGTAVLLHVNLATTLDLIGLQLPLLLGFIRIGCFFGGCCYGVRSRFGVQYPSEIFEPHNGSCQSFSPGKDPEQPVFPIQLVESGVSFVLFGVLFLRVSRGGVDGLTLPLYLWLYAGYRFVSDFARGSSARPDWGPLSEAQWVSLGILVVIGIAFVVGVVPMR